MQNKPVKGRPADNPDDLKIRSLLSLFLLSFKIGAVTFGGGYAMIPIMRREYVEKARWIGREDIVDVFAVSQSLPGVIAVNSSIMLGYRMAGAAGGLVTALGSVLPSFISLCAVTLAYKAFISNPFVAGAMRAMRGCVVGLILSAVFSLFSDSVKDRFSAVLFAAAFFTALLFPGVNAALIILGGAVCGLVFSIIRRKSGGNGGTGNG